MIVDVPVVGKVGHPIIFNRRIVRPAPSSAASELGSIIPQQQKCEGRGVISVWCPTSRHAQDSKKDTV